MGAKKLSKDYFIDHPAWMAQIIVNMATEENVKLAVIHVIGAIFQEEDISRDAIVDRLVQISANGKYFPPIETEDEDEEPIEGNDNFPQEDVDTYARALREATSAEDFLDRLGGAEPDVSNA